MATGSNAGEGKRIHVPWVAVAMYPKMEPKQWKSGGGQHMISVDMSPIREPI